ncbi:MAG TPA: MerR family transcriptional regulator [Gaiellaceae bacterium]|nr:MerR family transcriptional regulator [Gaiellaceae bacterium]
MTSAGPLLQIGAVAERVDLSLRTVRYYEEVGLVTPSARTVGGFRLYSDGDVARLLLVKRMKPLGLTLEETGELLELLDAGADPHGAADLERLVRRLESYAARADERIRKLERELRGARELRKALVGKLERCRTAAERFAIG